MPTFPIVNPKQFTLDLLEYLKQAYHYMTNAKRSNTIHAYSQPISPTLNATSDGILKPTLAPNHPQLKQQKAGTTFDEVLNAYNRSKTRKKLETEALMEQQQIQTQYKYDFINDPNVEQHIIMVLKALIAVIKANHEVEIQCIGNFSMIFGFLANNLFAEVSEIQSDVDVLFSGKLLEISNVICVILNEETRVRYNDCEVPGFV